MLSAGNRPQQPLPWAVGGVSNFSDSFCASFGLQDGRIVLIKVTSSLLLMLLGSQEAEFGMLKVKAQKLRDYLEAPLKDVMTDPAMEM